ncbi:hypothetical protein DPMN_038633 [Dreissena polymorpha]|uniref:Uncharacterized protein n=1 Tax=Dreissena polymorpha TaxID=45954 RepID=A0A9D4RQV8_DREPO|nr:hypothetical protein DPMN_038633 [Dreissena polymorpha]
MIGRSTHGYCPAINRHRIHCTCIGKIKVFPRDIYICGTELVMRPKDSGSCTWLDHVARFYAKHPQLPFSSQDTKEKCHSKANAIS